MNYRHAFHAGNFADLVKHAALLRLLETLQAGEPLCVIDTHAGRGLYDLAGPEARKSGEADAGIARLMAAKEAPAEFAPLTRAVAALNGGGAVRRYPGSPWLVAKALKAGSRYLGCELRADEHEALKRALADAKAARTLCADGYRIAAREVPPTGRALVLIDPPFERPDDYARIVETVQTVRARNPDAVVMIWLPLKDLATFDAFLGDLADAVEAPVLVSEARIAPLSDPMRMNGCALAFVGAPSGLDAPLQAICGWVASALGRDGAARVYQA